MTIMNERDEPTATVTRSSSSSSSNLVTIDDVLLLRDEDNFLPLPPKKASRATFPPGCSVILCRVGSTNRHHNNDTTQQQQASPAPLPLQALYGTVTQVGINLDDHGHRETLFQVTPHDNMPWSAGTATNTKTLLLVRGHDLVFAVGTPVWLSVGNSEDNDDWQPGVVLRSDQSLATNHAEPKVHYSVQPLSTAEGVVYNGITTDKIVYRGTLPDPPSKSPPKATATVKAEPLPPPPPPPQHLELPRPPLPIVVGARRVSMVPSEEDDDELV